MKIAIFTDTYAPQVSGVVTHIRILKEGLEEKGHEVLIVTVSPDVDDYTLKDNVLYCPGHAVKKIYGYGVTSPVSYHRLDMIKEFDPDVIHIQTEFAIGLFGLWTAKKLHKPIVYTLHTMYDDYTGYVFPHRIEKIGKSIAHRYFHIIAAHAKEIIVPSKKAITFLGYCGIKREFNYIPNIAEPDEYDPEKTRSIIEKYELDKAEAVLCFTGRMGKEKSVDVLLELFKKALEKHPGLRLILIGGGPEESDLRKQALKLGIGKEVIFTGMIPHEYVTPYLYASDLYATASTSEMNSISALEAKASGLMVLQRLDESNRDQIVDGVNGWTFETEDEFCALLDDYLKKSKEERDSLKERVMTYTRSFGKDEFLSRVEEIYKKVLR